MASTLMAAGAGIALFDWMNSKGQTLSITDNITTNMTIEANFISSTACVQKQASSQSIVIQAGTGDSYPNTDKLNDKDGGACYVCQNIMATMQQNRTQLETDAVAANPRYQGQNASDAMKNLMTGSASASSNVPGSCDAVCHDVASYNINQSATFQASESCSIDNVVTNDINQSVNGSINAYLKNQQDILGQLEDAFTTNTSSITNNLSTQMSQTITTAISQELLNNAFNSQQILVGLSNASGTSGAHSLFLNNVSQSFSSNTNATLKVNNQVNNSLRQSADYSIAQTLLNKNDTIGDVTQDFLMVIDTMAGMMETLTGQMLVILGCILAIVVMLVGAMYVFNKGFRNAMNARMDIYTNKLAGNTSGINNAKYDVDLG